LALVIKYVLNIMNEINQEKKEQWIIDHGRKECDVMEDNKGEYVYIEYEEGLLKVYLP